MNEYQRLYYNQAKSDFEIYCYLRGKPECHRLHYLQMCTEKLAKAYFYGKKTPPGKVHTGFAKFLRNLSSQKNIWNALGFARQEDLEKYVRNNRDIARQIEKLAPTETCAGDGPNPEYPWPPPPGLPVMAPIQFSFPLWKELCDTGKGWKFQELIQKLIQIFPEWF